MGVRTLDAYQHVADYAGGAVYGLSGSGPRYLAVFSAREGSGAAWWDICEYAQLAKRTLRLEEDNPLQPFLCGEALLEDAQSRLSSVSLQPLLARIRLSSVCCDFNGRPYSGARFHCKSLYLTGAGAELSLLGPPDRQPLSWINGGGIDSLAVEKLPRPDMVLQEGLGEIGEERLYPERDFYCYPGRETCLVLEGTLDGDTCFYPIPLSGMQPGGSYALHLTLRRKGAADCLTPVQPEDVQVETDTVPWERAPAQTLEVSFELSTASLTRAALPEESRISDYNLLIFNTFGDLEEHLFVPQRELGAPTEKALCTLTLLKDVPYTVLAAANLGYKLPIGNLEEARRFRYHLAYPEEYGRGLPLVALWERQPLSALTQLPLTRLMARIDLQLDCSAFSQDTPPPTILRACLEHPPSSVTLWPGSCSDGGFAQGFLHTGRDVDALNSWNANGRSEALPFYLLEDLEGEYTFVLQTESQKESRFRLKGPFVRNTVYPVTIRLRQP